MSEPAHRLTRDAIEGDFIRKMLENSDLGTRVLTPDELRASLESTLRARPGGPLGNDEDVWLFAYGSLIWNQIGRAHV